VELRADRCVLVGVAYVDMGRVCAALPVPAHNLLPIFKPLDVVLIGESANFPTSLLSNIANDFDALYEM
jgi:hypothetical protein